MTDNSFNPIDHHFETSRYFAYVVEDNYGSSIELTLNSDPASITVSLHEDASAFPEDVHSFCMAIMEGIFHAHKVFIPFKVYDHKGNLFTNEMYLKFDDEDEEDILTNRDPQIFIDDFDEEEGIF